MSEEPETPAEAEVIEATDHEPVELTVTRIDAELHEFQMVQRWGKLAAMSGYFPDVRGATPEAMIAQAAIKVMTGRELGFSTIASIAGVHIIDGRPVLGANMIAIAIKSSAKYDYRIVEHDATKCSIDIFEIIDGQREKIGTSTFTMADAQTAGLTQKDNWIHYPRNMLFARAISNGVAWNAPDVFSTRVYTPDEMGLLVDEAGEIDMKALPAPATPPPAPATPPPAPATPPPAPAESPPAKVPTNQSPPDPATIKNAGSFMVWATDFMIANRMPRPSSVEIATALGLNTVGEIAPQFKDDWPGAVALIRALASEPVPPESEEQPAAEPEQPVTEGATDESAASAQAAEETEEAADEGIADPVAVDAEPGDSEPPPLAE